MMTTIDSARTGVLGPARTHGAVQYADAWLALVVSVRSRTDRTRTRAGRGPTPPRVLVCLCLAVCAVRSVMASPGAARGAARLPAAAPWLLGVVGNWAIAIAIAYRIGDASPEPGLWSINDYIANSRCW